MTEFKPVSGGISMNRTQAERTDWSEMGASAGDELAALRERIRGLQDEVADADKRLRTILSERPFVSLAAAVVAGFVLGRIIGRA